MFFVHSGWKIQVADLETAIGWVGAEAERTVGRTQETSPGKSIRLSGDTDIWREIVSRTQLMGNDTANAGILDSGAWAPTSEHIVCTPIMIRLSVAHGTDHADLISDFSSLFEKFTEIYPLDLRLYGAQRSTVLDWC